MAMVKCPECENNISDNAITCPHCGNPIKDVTISYRTNSQIDDESTGKNTTAIIIGFVLQVIGCIVFLTFNNKYIDSRVTFGGDYNTYTYQTLVYIASALRFGITGILIGIGALLQCSKTTKYRGNSTTISESVETNKVNVKFNSNRKKEITVTKEKGPENETDGSTEANSAEFTVINEYQIQCNKCGAVQRNVCKRCYKCGAVFVNDI